MGLFKGLFKGLGTKANDVYTDKKVANAGNDAFGQVAKDIKKADKRGEYLGKKECSKRFKDYKSQNVKTAKSNGKARDRFIDGL